MNKNKNLKSIQTVQLSRHLPRFRRSLLAMAILSYSSSSTLFAQELENGDGTDSDDEFIEEVLVTGQRVSLETAIELKRASDTVADSIILDEAGKVPSTSLLEILERVPGVTMNRIRAGAEGSPDGFAFEGSGIQIRGLVGSKTLLNGREVFSASGGSGLGYADIGPELLKAVTVYKAGRADLIEGGVAGTVNLQTHMPFDFADSAVHASLSGSYGDFSEAVTPAASVLASKRFVSDTFGEFGVLVDLAYSEIESYDSNVLINPYFPTEYNGETVYAPGGIRFTNDQFERTRNGYYAALQWRPSENLEFFHTTFISERDSNRRSQIMDASTSTPTVFNGSRVEEGIYVSGAIGNPDGATVAVSGNSSYRPAFSKTSDFSTGFKYEGEDWELRASYQYVNVESGFSKNGFTLGTPGVVQTSLDLSGSLPQTRFVDPLTTDPTQVGATNFGWLTQANEGNSRAAQIDAGFDIGEGFFKRVEVGARAAKREESDNFVGTWWSATGRNWNQVPQLMVADAPQGDVELEEFENFFKDDIDAPGAVYVPTYAINQSDQFSRFIETYTACGPDLHVQCADPTATTYLYGDETATDRTLGLPVSNSFTTPETQSLYAMVGFEHESDHAFLNFSGNMGVRWIKYEVESVGNFSFDGGASYYRSVADAEASLEEVGGRANLDAWLAANPDTPLPHTYVSVSRESERSGSFSEDYFMPSLNLKFEPIENWVFRYALTKTLTPPRYADIRAQGTASVQTTDNPLGIESLPDILAGYNYVSGTTTLRPEVSLNNDISLEWYPRKGSSVHFSLFHKNIEDKIIFNKFNALASEFFSEDDLPLSVASDDEALSFVDAAVIGNGNINATEDTIIRGAEIGGRTYFDELPGWLSGFGITANITYIDDDAPDALALDMNGDEMNVPVIGLSEWAYTATLLYDYQRVSARLAWNWRNRYLSTTSDASTTNTYTNAAGETISYGLPVYGAATGRLDGSISYRISDSMNIKLNVQNITNEVAETEMEILPGTFVNRGYFVTDRRISLHLGIEF